MFQTILIWPFLDCNIDDEGAWWYYQELDDDDEDDVEDDYVDGREMSIDADAMVQESDIEGSYGTNPNEGKKMYNHRWIFEQFYIL